MRTQGQGAHPSGPCRRAFQVCEMSEQDTVTAEHTPRKRHGRDFNDITARFFKVDVEAFRAAASLGNSQATAYLVLACGTGPDHRTTGWSAKAIEDRTSLHGTKAKEAIRHLAEVGLLRVVKDGTRPLYELNAFNRQQLTEAWLPQSFVGTKENKGPLKYFRSQKDTTQLQAMIDVYSRTNMDISCGVDWRVSENPNIVFKKRAIRELDRYIVHGFSCARWSGTMPTGQLDQLVQSKQIAIIPHIIEHDGADAEVCMPAGSWWNGLDWERAIGFDLERASDAMLQNHDYEPIKGEIIVPYSKSFPDIELVGIVRPFLLPMTAPTLKWASKRSEWMSAASEIGRLANSFTF